MLTEKQCDDYLKIRFFEPASTNLAERIIAAAKEKPVYASRTVLDYLREAIESLFPHPAYAFAAILVMGILIGYSLPENAGSKEFAVTTEEELL